MYYSIMFPLWYVCEEFLKWQHFAKFDHDNGKKNLYRILEVLSRGINDTSRVRIGLARLIIISSRTRVESSLLESSFDESRFKRVDLE